METDHKKIVLMDSEKIQYAHDLLWAAHFNEQKIGFFNTEKDRELARAALDVLCWILKHEHNKQFETNLSILSKEMIDKGQMMTIKNNPAPSLY